MGIGNRNRKRIRKLKHFITFVQIKEKLGMKNISYHEKQEFMNEIARDCFNPPVLALEYCPDWHKKQVIFFFFQAIL